MSLHWCSGVCGDDIVPLTKQFIRWLWFGCDDLKDSVGGDDNFGGSFGGDDGFDDCYYGGNDFDDSVGGDDDFDDCCFLRWRWSWW